LNLPFTSSLEYLNSRYPPTLNVKQVAEITSEAPATINSALSRGEYPIPSFRLSRVSCGKSLIMLPQVSAMDCAAGV